MKPLTVAVQTVLVITIQLKSLYSCDKILLSLIKQFALKVIICSPLCMHVMILMAETCSVCLKSNVEWYKMVSVGSIKMHQSWMHDCLWWLAKIHSIVELSSHVTKSYFPVCHSPVCIQGSDLCSAVLHFNENSCTPCLSVGRWLRKGRNMC